MNRDWKGALKWAVVGLLVSIVIGGVGGVVSSLTGWPSASAVAQTQAEPRT
jgi:hypothetical protein